MFCFGCTKKKKKAKTKAKTKEKKENVSEPTCATQGYTCGYTGGPIHIKQYCSSYSSENTSSEYTSSSQSISSSSSFVSYSSLLKPISFKIHVPNGFQDTKAESEKDSCVVCLENKKCCLLLPCSHLCICLTCVNTGKDNVESGEFRCPLCRASIQSCNVAFL